MTPKEKLVQALFTLKFFGFKDWIIQHQQHCVLRTPFLVKVSPGQMIADNTPMWWENAMNNWCKGLRRKKGWGYALVISDDGQHHWVPGRHVKERKERGHSSTSTLPESRQWWGKQNWWSATAPNRFQGPTKPNPPFGVNWRNWPLKGKIGQRTGTAFDLGHLVPGYVICGNHHIWQPITKKVEGQDMEAT